MNYATRRAERRRAIEQQHRPDTLQTPDGVAIPVWDADAADPIAYLASVMDLLPGSRPAESGGWSGMPGQWEMSTNRE